MSSIMNDNVDKVNHNPADPADELFDAIHALMHVFRSRQHRALRDDGPADLTHQEFKVLMFFARRPGATQADLITRSGQDKGQIARLVASLRERGLLEASADANDRRVQRLAPTAAGRKLQATLRARGREVAESSLQGISVQERRKMLGWLQQMRSNLQDDAPPDGAAGTSAGNRRGRSGG
jgi:DNA-binding MarR family transcriptional regulator